MNIVRSFIGTTAKQELISIPMGQYDLLRSKDSPKSSLECIYNEAIVTIKEVGKYTYELVVNKLEEYIEDDDNDGSEEFVDDAMSVLSVQSKKKEEKWTFRLSEKLGFHKKWNKQGDVVLVWNNTIGDEEDERVQFVISSDCSLSDIEGFIDTYYRCAYSFKYKSNPDSATYDDINKIEEACLKQYTCKEEEIMDDFDQLNNLSEELPSLLLNLEEEFDDEIFFDVKEFPEK